MVLDKPPASAACPSRDPSSATARRDEARGARERDVDTFDDKLIAALRQNRPDVAAISAEILGQRRVSGAVAPLIAALDRWLDADDVSMAIIQALAELRDEAAIVPLTGVLRHRHLRQRIAAVQALGCFTHPAADEALHQAAMHDPNAAVRRAAADVLKVAHPADRWNSPYDAD